MKLEVINKRIERNKFIELAGEFYCDRNSQPVCDLKNKNEDVLFGIKNEKGLYTILGIEHTYFKSKNGKEGKILNKDFLKTLQKNAMNVGKKDEFEFIDINEEDSVWIVNGELMCSIWNTVKFLCDNESK